MPFNVRKSVSLDDAAPDGTQIPAVLNGEEWRVTWHPPPEPPPGTPHGVAAVCLAGESVVLVSHDGLRWDLPGGRPEPGETAAGTLRREIREEACATVTESRLVGFTSGTCLTGPEQGVTLVRSLWRAQVRLGPWKPEFEITHRRVVPAADVFSCLGMPDGMKPIYRRFLAEALQAGIGTELPPGDRT